MRKSITLIRTLLIGLLFINPLSGSAREENTDSAAYQLEQYMLYMDSIQATIPFQEGVVKINDIANLDIPKGYKFIPANEARMIVEDFWGNPEDSSVLGMVVKSDYSVANNTDWAFVISYEESGYVKDEDADDLDYDQMLIDIQESEAEINKQRIAEGYPSVHVLAWATKPFYDKERKILHWARKIKFGDEMVADGDLTLNYDIRFLGRKGVLSMNAVGTMSQLDDINNHIPDVLNTTKFTDGNSYSDFNPDIDKVAAYTIGGLIAGKLLAKAGLFVLLLKNIKLIILGLVAIIAASRKKIAALFTRRKNEIQPLPAPSNISEPEEGDIAVRAENDNTIAGEVIDDKKI